MSEQWLLPRIPVYAAFNGRPVSLPEIRELIKRGLLKPNYPVGRPRLDVIRADACPEIREVFQEFRIATPAPEEEIDFPREIITELHTRTGLRAEALTAPSAARVSSGPGANTLLQGRPVPSARSLLLGGPLNPPPAPARTPTHTRLASTTTAQPQMAVSAMSAAPTETGMLMTTELPEGNPEWYLPPIPDFKAMCTKPVGLREILELIRRHELTAYHRLRRGDGPDLEEGYAGSFPELIPELRRTYRDFHPEDLGRNVEPYLAVRRLVQANSGWRGISTEMPAPVEAARPQAAPRAISKGGARSLGTRPAAAVAEGGLMDRVRDWFASAQPPEEPGTNQFVFASRVGLVAGLVFWLVSLLFAAFPNGYLDSFGRTWIMHLLGAFVLFVMSVGSMQVSVHLVGAVNGYNRIHNWSFGMIYSAVVCSQTVMDAIYLALQPMPDLGVLGAFLRPGLWSVAAILIGNLFAGLIVTLVLVQVANSMSADLDTDTAYYRLCQPGERDFIITVLLMTGILLSGVNLYVDYYVKARQMRAISNLFSGGESISVEDLTWTADRHDDGTFSVKFWGNAKNNSGESQEHWQARFVVLDEDDHLLVKVVLRSKNFREYTRPKYPGPVWSEERESFDTSGFASVILGGKPVVGSDGALKGREIYPFEYEAKKLPAFPERVVAIAGDQWRRRFGEDD